MAKVAVVGVAAVAVAVVAVVVDGGGWGAGGAECVMLVRPTVERRGLAMIEVDLVE